MTKRIFTLMMMFGAFISIYATNPVNIEDGINVVKAQTENLEAIEALVLEEGLTYDELATSYPELMATSNIASEASEDGIFDKSSDSPLGIGGFWWGLGLAGCGSIISPLLIGVPLGILAMLLVYLSMDEGSDRKEQVRNTLYGCLIGVGLGFLLRVLILAASIN